jgi:hypothetical protein
MAELLPPIPLEPNVWVDLYDATGIPVGTKLMVQHLVASKRARLVESTTMPTLDTGFNLIKDYEFMFNEVGAVGAWAMSTGHSRLQVEEATLGGFKQESVEHTSTGRAKVSTSTREESQILEGNFFVGTTTRLDVPVGNINYIVLEAPADKYLVVEDTQIEPDFLEVSSGKYTIDIEAFVESSNGNSWSYTEGSRVPVGRSLNTGYINVLPTSTIDLAPVVSALTGLEDYPVFFADYLVAEQRNRITISSSGNSFFTKGRQIVLAPSERLLIRTVTGGDAAVGTISIKSIFFTSEVDASTI